MTSHVPQLPEALIHAVTESKLHGFVAETFLCGLYTLLFGQAMWRLFCKGNKWIYMLVLTTLWGLIIGAFAADWEQFRITFTVYNDSPSDMALHAADASETMPKVDVILDSTFLILAILLGDGLLVWRCYLLWNGNAWNKYIIALFALLLTGTTVVGFMFWNPHSHFSHHTGSALTAVFFLLSATTTFLGTTMIILRIILVTKRSKSPHSYRKLIEILVESSVVYSIGTIIIGVTELVLLRDYSHPSGNYAPDEVATYAGALLTPLTGIAPTLIALRVGKEHMDAAVEGTRPTPLKFKRENAGAQNTTRGSRGILSALRFARTNTARSGGTVDSQDISQIYDEVQGAKGDSGFIQDYDNSRGAEKRPVEHIV